MGINLHGRFLWVGFISLANLRGIDTSEYAEWMKQGKELPEISPTEFFLSGHSVSSPLMAHWGVVIPTDYMVASGRATA